MRDRDVARVPKREIKRGRRRCGASVLKRAHVRGSAFPGPVDARAIAPGAGVIDRDRARGHAADRCPPGRTVAGHAVSAGTDDLNDIARRPRLCLRTDEIHARVGDMRPRTIPRAET